jgi:hypothetical protein
MKRFIILSAMVWFCVVNITAQRNEIKRLPTDTIPLLLPPFELKRNDTLRFNPGDTIPYPIWEQYLRKKGATQGKTLEAPIDNMPVIMPPDHNFYMIVTKPDTIFHYYMRNLMDENKISDASEKPFIPKRKFKQNK